MSFIKLILAWVSHFLSQLAQVLKLIFYYSKSTNTSQDEIAGVCPALPRD